MEQTLKMKLLLMTCLLGSVSAAPAKRMNRDILPGDSRYHSKQHEDHAEDEHQKSNVEILKSLGGYAGTFSALDINSESVTLDTRAFFDNTDFLKHTAVPIEASVTDSMISQLGDRKVSEQLRLFSEGDFTLPQDESVTVAKPSDISPSDGASSTNSVGNHTESHAADTESIKDTGETDVTTKSAGDQMSSGISKEIVESPFIDVKSSIKPIFSNEGLTTGSLTTSFRNSPFDSTFTSFGGFGYNPSFSSSEEYTPESDRFNTNSEYHNSHGGHPLNFGTYSQYDYGVKSDSSDSRITNDFSQLNAVDFTENIPHSPHSSFFSLPSVAKEAPSEFKLSLVESYSIPLVDRSKQQFDSTLFPLDQSKLSKNYNHFTFSEPTTTSVQTLFQPEIRISAPADLGTSQLTDVNGGYIY